MEMINFSQEAIVNRLLVQVFFFWLRKWFKTSSVCLLRDRCPIKLEPDFFFGGTVCVTTYWACKVDSPNKNGVKYCSYLEPNN